MKITKKNTVLMALLVLTTTSTICPMDPMSRNDENLVWVALAGAAIAGGALAFKLFLSYVHSQPTTFTDLPKEIQQQIMGLVLTGATAESLEVASQTLNTLAQVNKEFNNFINSDEFLKETIPMLAERFNCDNLTVIRALKIKATKDFLRRLEEEEQASFDMLRKAGF